MKDTDIIAAIAPDAVSLMDKAIAEIKRLRQENATLTAERDEMQGENATLTAERDEMQGELRKAETESSMLRVECGVIAAERDEARRIAAYQYAKHSNYGDESFAMKNFFQFHKWEYLKEDCK